ncbi:hypothetical protein D3C85_1805580 [compost metagenome]
MRVSNPPPAIGDFTAQCLLYQIIKTLVDQIRKRWVSFTQFEGVFIVNHWSLSAM